MICCECGKFSRGKVPVKGWVWTCGECHPVIRCGECHRPMRMVVGGPRDRCWACDECMIITGGWG